MGCIYLLYNEAGYGYIGQTVNIKERLRLHHLKSELSKSKLLGDFKCEILEECMDDYLNDYEQYYYEMYKEMFPNMLINGKNPSRSLKEYRLKEKERLKAEQLIYKEKNKEIINKRRKDRRKQLKILSL